MASSDDESDSVSHTVSNYYFVDQINEPISFSELPVQWTAGENPGRESEQIFLHGTADNGLKIYKQVLAWKFDITHSKPEIFVLSKENNWIKLLKPRKSFEVIIRSVLITVYCLHHVAKKPEAAGKALWDQLSKVFSSYETRPSEIDLVRHTALISEAVKRDETLGQSKFLMNFLEGKPQEKNEEDLRTIPNASFIVDDDMIDVNYEDDGCDGEDDDLFDKVCSICDNGGEIICCDGRCMRSFHATEKAGSESYCASLGWSDEQVEATPSFVCKNCQFQQHQCFVCGKLGSSDKLSGAEVFPCVNATCGRFYHPLCVAKLLHRDNAAAIEEFQKKASAGEKFTFTCPVHKCIVCKQGEDKNDPDLQFAVCRRCPKSYHRKCLPRKIAFEDDEDKGILQRAWPGLLDNRILIYCLKHEIDDELKTPLRNHILFPGDQPKKKQQESRQFPRSEKAMPTKKSVTSEDEVSKRNVAKVKKGVRLSSSVEKTNMSKQSVKRVAGPGSLKKSEGKDASKPSSSVLGSRLYDYYNSTSFKGLPEKEHSEKVIEKPEKPVTTDMGNSFRLDNDSKQRIMSLMEEATSSVTLDQIIEKHKVPTTHGNSKYPVDKSITLGKVEGSVEAIRAALQKLEEGGSIEDAKAVCEPGLLQQIARWKNKMKVYLAPFLYGMRYTSFGRHFTKVDKLNEIVNVLHRYVQDGDMIVDFCCGANDFSWLMKTKLDEIGKKCSYKNFDILQAKNDFNFERRDWMTVQTEELPEGSRLIMGLNPPFGVNAALANKFIDKALEFKPKLVILIVPKETERLDKKKKMPYDLIWEDNQLLAGKSFYLPGSVDVNDNQLEDWNNSAPPLYLWSRPDWTNKHKAIAQKHGHLSGLGQLSHLQDEEDKPKSLTSDLPLEDNGSTNLVPTPVHDHHIAKEEQVPTLDTIPNMAKNLEGEPRADVKEVDEGRTHLSDEIGEDSNKRKRDNEEHARGGSVQAPNKSNQREHEKGSGQNLRRKKKKGGKKSHLPQFNVANKQPSKLPESRLDKEVRRERDYHDGQNLASSDSLPRTEYGVAHMDEHERRHRLTSDEFCAGPTHQRSGPSPDYGARNVEHFPGHHRESLDSHVFRSQSPYGGGGVHEQYARSAATPRAGLYESQGLSSFGQRSNFMGSSQDTMYSSSYNRMDPMMNASAIDRYAPRLGETNNIRMNNPPPVYEQYGVPRNGYTTGYDQFGVAGTGNHLEYDPYGRTGNPGSLAPRSDYRVDSSGFAPGPRSFTPQNSSGWLNE